MKPIKITIEIDAAQPRNAGIVNQARTCYENKKPAAYPEFDGGRYVVTKLKQKGQTFIIELLLTD